MSEIEVALSLPSGGEKRKASGEGLIGFLARAIDHRRGRKKEKSLLRTFKRAV